MLNPCPECQLPVSDKAQTCPHCGYPLKEPPKRRKQRGNNKRRRLPNGFGQISEIKNRNLRNPFRAMVTVGKDDDGRPICKLLKPKAYFETYNEAYQALVDYNKNPYDLSPTITVAELYKKWFVEYEKTVKDTQKVKSAWSYCSSIYDMPVVDVRARHIKGCMDEGTAIVQGIEKHPNASMKNRIKSMFNQMLDYAVEYELVDRNYSRTFKLTEETIKEIQTVKKGHIIFTNQEMEALWSALGNVPAVDILLIQCYSGWRPRELGLIELKNVDLENGTFKGGIKTEAGENRVVPIHSRIRSLVEARYHEAEKLKSQYLFNWVRPEYQEKAFPLTYNKYQAAFAHVIEILDLNPEHRPHDGRTHFVTAAKQAGADEYAIKYIVGHKISDITEKIYTKRTLEWLKQEIEKIP